MSVILFFPGKPLSKAALPGSVEKEKIIFCLSGFGNGNANSMYEKKNYSAGGIK